MKIASNADGAQEAVSGFAGIDLSAPGQQVRLSSSNVSCMQDGAIVANTITSCIVDLISEVKVQATHVTALATEIENRDKQDTQGWCEAR